MPPKADDTVITNRPNLPVHRPRCRAGRDGRCPCGAGFARLRSPASACWRGPPDASTLIPTRCGSSHENVQRVGPWRAHGRGDSRDPSAAVGMRG
jgi:hypothetical protein